MLKTIGECAHEQHVRRTLILCFEGNDQKNCQLFEEKVHLGEMARECSDKSTKRGQKIGTLHEFACHPYAGVHANLLCIVPSLVHVPPKRVRYLNVP